MLANSGGRRRWRQRRTNSRSAAAAGSSWSSASGICLLIGLLTLTVQLVNTNGNYILNETLARMARATIAAGNSAQTEGQIIGSFMAGLDFWQNVLSMAIQFFLVSRIFKYLGIGGALFVLPVLALGSYGLFAFAPVLAFIRLTKIAENATDYSLQNTVRRALFLPTSRDAKYKALQAVETFFWRAGDMLSASGDVRDRPVAGALGSRLRAGESRDRRRVAGAGGEPGEGESTLDGGNASRRLHETSRQRCCCCWQRL